MKRSTVLVAAALISALLLSACGTTASSTPVSSADASSEVVSTESTVSEVTSDSASAVVSTDTSSTASEAASSETSSVISSETTSTPVTAGTLAYDSATAASLLSSINAARTTALTADTGLDAVAQAYAKVLYEAGADFRKTTDFKTLPSGEKVSSLIKSSGYTGTVSSFNYSVYIIDNTVKGSTSAMMTAKVLASSQYATKAVAGDYSKVGIACGSVSDGTSTSFSIIILVYSK